MGILTTLDILEHYNTFCYCICTLLPRGIQKLVEETMKGLTGFIAAIFLISLSAGLIHHYTATEKPNEVPDSTMTFEPADTTTQEIHKQQTL
jgi:hypothetical protein